MRIFGLNHSSIDFVWSASVRDFEVREIPLYEWSGAGEWAILSVRKKGVSTFEMVQILSEISGAKVRDIGYAGLKDKAATTTQFISIHRSFLAKLLESSGILAEKNIKIIEHFFHANKLKIGHLKGNRFWLRLKKVSAMNAVKIAEVAGILERVGLPNYFGNQRFGNDGLNYEEGRKLLESNGRGLGSSRNKKLNNFLLSSYQSFLFNEWLKERMKLSKIVESFSGAELKNALDSTFGAEFLASLGDASCLKSQEQFFKILKGDIMEHFPHGKAFEVRSISEESKRFNLREISPTGLLCGTNSMLATNTAGVLESRFIDNNLLSPRKTGFRSKVLGTRRYAWTWPSELKTTFEPKTAQLELEFTLPKGSYATIFVEALKNDSKI